MFVHRAGLPVTRQYQTDGAIHGVLGDTPGEKLHLDTDYLGRVRFENNGHNQAGGPVSRTPLREVSVAPPVIPRVEPHDDFLDSMRDALGSLFARWPGYGYDSLVVFHSSGIDTRIISGVMAELRAQGRLPVEPVMICWEPEAAEFAPIMEYAGWERWFTYREGINVDYRAELVGFGDVWRYVNCYGLPWCVAGPSLDEARRRGMVGDNPLIISGFGANELGQQRHWRIRYGYRSIGHYMAEKFYYERDIAAIWAGLGCDVYLPYADAEVAPTVPGGKGRCAALKELDPGLAALPGHSWPDLNEYPNWCGADIRLSPDTEYRCAVDYASSDYGSGVIDGVGKELIGGVPPLGDDWWREYWLASLCQHLVEKGVEIA